MALRKFLILRRPRERSSRRTHGADPADSNFSPSLAAKPIGSACSVKVANYRWNFLAGGSFFFTVNLADRRLTLFKDHIDLLRAVFLQVRARHPFTIEAAVILPDHLHAIWTFPEQDADFALRWRLDEKRLFARSDAR